MPFSSNTTSSYAPTGHGTALSRPSRAERFSAPRVTSVEEPSGATSHRRATTWPYGTSIRSRAVTCARPRTSTGSRPTGNSKQADFASSSRWSGGRSASLPNGKNRPASSPVCCGEATATGAPWSAYVTGVTAGEGHSASPTQRPGSTSYVVAGGWDSEIQERSRGSSITPLSPAPEALSESVFSQWSHHRRVSWRNPIAGPGGSPRSGYWCDHGPISPRTRSAGRRETSRSTASRYGSCQPPTARTAAPIAG